MKYIILSADERLIEAARQRARSMQSTLNEEFWRWLEHYAAPEQELQRYDAVMAELLGRVTVGRTLSHDERNER